MEVLRTKALSDKAAAKMLEKFVAAKQDEENADLMVNEEVKAQLTQVLEFLKDQQTRTDTQKE